MEAAACESRGGGGGARGGSTYHAQLINELVPICHRKAQFSRETRGDETNHLHYSGTMPARLFLALNQNQKNVRNQQRF